MGQKVNPHGMRVGVIKDWDSRWFVSDEKFGETLVSDKKIRTFLKNELKEAGVPKIEIERKNVYDARTGKNQEFVRILVHCAKPGFVIGKDGVMIEKYRQAVSKMVPGAKVVLDVTEVRQPDLNAQLVAENIAAQLERRVTYRKAMKMAIRNTMRLGAKGIKITCGGRLGGVEISRSEHYHEGPIPLQTLRADIDYGFAEAATTYGRIGVKVWIYASGEVLREVTRPGSQRDNRRGDRRDNRRGGGDRRGNNPNGQQNSNGRRFNNDGRPRQPRPAGDRPARTPRDGGTK